MSIKAFFPSEILNFVNGVDDDDDVDAAANAVHTLMQCHLPNGSAFFGVIK